MFDEKKVRKGDANLLLDEISGFDVARRDASTRAHSIVQTRFSKADSRIQISVCHFLRASNIRGKGQSD
jgi:hypothetical protein